MQYRFAVNFGTLVMYHCLFMDDIKPGFTGPSHVQAAHEDDAREGEIVPVQALFLRPALPHQARSQDAQVRGQDCVQGFLSVYGPVVPTVIAIAGKE